MDADEEGELRDDGEVWLEAHDAALVAATRRQTLAKCAALARAEEADWRGEAGKAEPGSVAQLAAIFVADTAKKLAEQFGALADREPEG